MALKKLPAQSELVALHLFVRRLAEAYRVAVRYPRYYRPIAEAESLFWDNEARFVAFDMGRDSPVSKVALFSGLALLGGCYAQSCQDGMGDFFALDFKAPATAGMLLEHLPAEAQRALWSEGQPGKAIHGAEPFHHKAVVVAHLQALLCGHADSLQQVSDAQRAP